MPRVFGPSPRRTSIDVSLHEHAGRRPETSLIERAEERAVDCILEVGVGEEDAGRSATSSSDTLQPISGAAHDHLAHFGAAGERDLPNIVSDYQAPAPDIAGDDVPRPRGLRCLESSASARIDSGVCRLAEHDGATGCQGRGAIHAAIISG